MTWQPDPRTGWGRSGGASGAHAARSAALRAPGIVPGGIIRFGKTAYSDDTPGLLDRRGRQRRRS